MGELAEVERRSGRGVDRAEEAAHDEHVPVDREEDRDREELVESSDGRRHVARHRVDHPAEREPDLEVDQLAGCLDRREQDEHEDPDRDPGEGLTQHAADQ